MRLARLTALAILTLTLLAVLALGFPAGPLPTRRRARPGAAPGHRGAPRARQAAGRRGLRCGFYGGRNADTLCLTDFYLEVIMKLSMRIKQLRKRREMTQEALARSARVSLAYIGRLETGHHDPKLSTLRKLAKALGVPVADLIS
jgi:DNA-binding XRE family transcriptional regulator